MTRKLEALGLAFLAAFALSAVVASTASAQQGTLTSDGPVTLTGTETGVQQNWIEVFGARIECPGSTFSEHKVATTPHVPISVPATEATLTPKFLETVGGQPNCKVPGLGLTATIDMNGCDFVTKAGETTGGGDTYGVKFSVVCPANSQIEMTLWTGAHTNPTFCSIDIPGNPATGVNQDLTGAHLTDTTNGTIDVQGLVTGITATKTKHGAGILCPHEHTNGASLTVDITVKGDNAAGGATSIGISHP